MAAATTEQATATTMGASGYDEFVEDSEKIQLPSSPQPQQTTAPAGGGGGGESWTKSIADGAQQAQGMIMDGAQRAQGTITDYFPPASPCSGADLANRGAELVNHCSDLKDLKNPCVGGAAAGGDNKPAAGKNNNADEVPGLAASSSSEDGTGTATTKSKLADWADKFGSCHMDTACGKLELEFMKKEEKPEPSRANALTEQGELLKIEGPPLPKPWTEELSEKVHVAQEGATAKSSRLMVALGLAEKKDQHLITDYYKPNPVSGETEKSLSERFQEAQASVATTARGLYVSVAAAGKGAAPKQETMEEKQQKLITDFDPNKSEAAAAALTEEEIPAVISIATEPTEYIDQVQESKPSSGWWSRVKAVFKMPAKVPTCEDMSKVDVPACSPLPKVEVPSFKFNMASCLPTAKAEEPKAEVPKAEEPKAEVPKAEEPKAEVPKTVIAVEEKEEKKEEAKEQVKQEVKPEEKEEEQPAPVTSKSQNESSLPW